MIYKPEINIEEKTKNIIKILLFDIKLIKIILKTTKEFLVIKFTKYLKKIILNSHFYP